MRRFVALPARRGHLSDTIARRRGRRTRRRRRRAVRYRRILLKISGEALLGQRSYGVDPDMCVFIARRCTKSHDLGVQVAVVVGGGNIFRGLAASAKGMDRATGDYIGMLATVMNGLALQDALEKDGVPTRVMSAIAMNEVAEPYIRRRAVRHLEKGRVDHPCRGHRQPVLHDRYRGGAARGRDRRRGPAQGDQGRRRLRQRSADQPAAPCGTSGWTMRRCSVTACRSSTATAVTLCMENDLPIVVFDSISRATSRLPRLGGTYWHHHRRWWRAGTMTDEIRRDADARMSARHRGARARPGGNPHRPRRHGAGRAHPGRVLRHARRRSTSWPASACLRRTDRHPAVGSQRAGRDREGHPEERGGPDAQRRRHRRAPGHPAADRGASQGPRASSSTSAWKRRASRSATTVATWPTTIKRAEQDGDIGADEERREMEQLQKVTDRWTDEVERVGKHKEQEIMEVG